MSVHLTEGHFSSSFPSAADNSIGIVNDLFTLIPNSEFDNDHLGEIIASSCQKELSGQMEYDDIPEFGSSLCYMIEPVHARFCQQAMSECKTYHVISCMLRGIARKGKSSLLYFHQLGSVLIIILVKDGKLHLANLFPYSSIESVLYYAILARNVYELKEDIPIQLAGSHSLVESGLLLLRKYFTDVNVHEDLSSLDKNYDEGYLRSIEFIERCAS